jgi:hypothetical protein
MASVEALSQMRSLADYMIASPTEIMIAGFPYDRVVKTLFGDWSEQGMKQVGSEFVDYYTNVGNEGAYSGTIAVVKMDQMEGLAQAVRRMVLSIDNPVTSVDGIQYYERYSRPGHVFFDLDDYLIHARKDAMPTEYNAFVAQLERTVIYKGHTRTFYSAAPLSPGYVTVNHFSGLAVFIPWSQTASFVSDYLTTEWYQDVYSNQWVAD